MRLSSRPAVAQREALERIDEARAAVPWSASSTPISPASEEVALPERNVLDPGERGMQDPFTKEAFSTARLDGARLVAA